MAVQPIIYHGTPMTPRTALTSVCTGRAMCVSFYRPDDAEVVEAISPAIMFRQRRVFVLETGSTRGAGMGGRSGLVGLFHLARTEIVRSRALGCNPGHARSAITAQRQPAAFVAVRAEGRAAVAYGWANRTAPAAMRQIRPGMLGLDGRRQGDRLPSLSPPHGRGCCGLGQSMARYSHDARHGDGVRLSLCQRGQHLTRTERMAL